MIFAPDMVEAVVHGTMGGIRKTVTRRPATHVTLGRPATWDERDQVEPCRRRVGRTYAVQRGRGKHGEARIRVTAVDLQPLSEAFTREEARREGFRSIDAFKQRWISLHRSLDPNQAVWRIEFELAPSLEQNLATAVSALRFYAAPRSWRRAAKPKRFRERPARTAGTDRGAIAREALAQIEGEEVA